MSRVVLLVAIAVLIAFFAGFYEKQQSSDYDLDETQLTELSETFDYNVTIGEIVAALNDIQMAAAEIDPLLETVASGEVEFAAVEQEMNATISRLEMELQEHESAISDILLTVEVPKGIKEGHEAISREALAYVQDQSKGVSATLERYRQQIDALRRGDVDGYYALVGDEVVAIIAGLEAESRLLQSIRDQQHASSPEYFIRDAMIHGNDAMAIFLGFLNTYDVSSIEEDVQAMQAMGESIDKYASAIDHSERAAAAFETQMANEGLTFAAGETFAKETRLAIAAERSIIKIVRNYHKLGVRLTEGDDVEDIIQSIYHYDQLMQAAVDRRTELTFSRQAAALGFVNAASSDDS